MIRKFSFRMKNPETISKKDSDKWLERKIDGIPYFMLQNLRGSVWGLN